MVRDGLRTGKARLGDKFRPSVTELGVYDLAPAIYLLPWNSSLPSGELSRCSVKCIVVLGGMEDARVRPARHAYAIDEAAKRLTEAAALARRSPEFKQLNPLSDATTSPGVYAGA